MKWNSTFTILALILSNSCFANASNPITDSSKLEWHPTSDLTGAKIAILMGNPTKNEPFVARVKLPANFNTQVHTHLINEYDTIISGNLYFGWGTTADQNHAQLLAPGSFISIPAHASHYAWTKEETIIQVNGIGPWGMVYKKQV